MVNQQYQDKVNKFIELINNRPLADDGKPISNGKCAELAGWAQSRCYKTASELLRKPEIAKKIRQAQEAENIALKTGEDSVKEILESNLPQMLRDLKNKPDKFIKAYLDFQKHNKEELGDYDGYSIGQIIKELDQTVKEIDTLKKRVMEEIREEEMQE